MDSANYSINMEKKVNQLIGEMCLSLEFRKPFLYAWIRPEDEVPIHNVDEQTKTFWVCLYQGLHNLNRFLKALSNRICVFLFGKNKKMLKVLEKN